MNPQDYDSWYDSARGRWIGEAEYRLLLQQLEFQPGDRVLDVGCGTGWFTRRIAELPKAQVTGIDLDHDALAFARAQDAKSTYIAADARSLPFADNEFDRVLSVTALCFVRDWPLALREIIRVTRKSFAIGLLNRHSLLRHQKGRGKGQGGYSGAHWHSGREVLAALAGLPVKNLRVRTAIWFPGGSWGARAIERCLPNRFPFGGFLLIAGDKHEIH